MTPSDIAGLNPKKPYMTTISTVYILVTTCRTAYLKRDDQVTMKNVQPPTENECVSNIGPNFPVGCFNTRNGRESN